MRKRNVESEKQTILREPESSYEKALKQKYRAGFIKGIICAVILCCAVVVLISWWTMNRKVEVTVRGNGDTVQTARYPQVLDNSAIEKINYLAAFIQANYYEEVDGDDLVNAMYKGMFESLDEYSDYYTQEEYQDLLEQEVTGSFSGIGATLQQDRKTKQVTVVSVQEGSPAEKAGLQSGDVVVEADGYQASDMELSEFVQHVHGEEGTSVHLVVQREGVSGQMEFDITRSKVETQTVTSDMLNDKIGYLKISEFTNNTPKQFEAALEELENQDMQGLVVDLRNNPGGMLTAVTEILDDILPEGMIVYTEDRAGNRQEYRSTDEKVLSVPTTVLVNENSASASEIFAGAIKDRDYGTLIGTTTFGKGIVQGIQEFNDKTAVKLTTSRYYTPNGTCIQGKGIEPDIKLEYKFQGGENDKYSYSLDNQIQKAVEVLEQEID